MKSDLRVLIVEDSEDDALLLLREMRKGGITPIFERVDTAEALRASLDRQDWDVIICDYLMSALSGPAALRLVQESGLDVPFIMVTGQVGEATAIETLTAGAHDYVMKGNLARLVPALQRVLQDAVLRRERREADEALRRAHEELRLAHAELEKRVQERTAELQRVNEELENEIVERKQAEEVVHRAAAFNEAAMKNLGEGLYTIDEKGLVTFMNPASEQLFGWSFAELRGKKMHDMTHHHYPDGRPLPSSECAGFQVLSHGRQLVNHEDVFIRKDGTFFPVTYSISPMRDDTGKITGQVVVFRDITERKQAEEALRQERDFAQSLIDTAQVIVLVLDTGGRIVRFNPYMESISGYRLGEVQGKDWFSTFLPERDRDRMRQVFLRAVSDIQTRGNVNPIVAKDGYERQIEWYDKTLKDANGKTVGVLAIGQDITERKRTEEALRESEERLHIAKEAAGQGIHDFDVTAGTIQWDERARELWGVGPNLPITYDVFMAGVHPEDRQRVQEAENRALDPNGRGEYHAEYRVVSLRDGVECWVASTGHVSFEQGRAVRLVGTVQDITARKRAEEERERLLTEVQRRAAELDAANKELEAFSYSVSHDLRAPLRHIDGFSKVLLQEYADGLDERGKQYLQFLREGSERMEALIDALLKLSRVTRAEMRRGTVNLSEIAESIAVELRQDQPERQAEFAIEPDVTANGDARLLRVVLENLLGNAWKFTAKRPVAKIEFRVTEQDQRPVYYLKDNGAGFDMAYAEKLFVPFQRFHSEEEFPGTGIGLATVQRIVRRHGGRVWAEGEVDKGATFYFTLS